MIKIEEILKELFSLDPELKNKESELRKIIGKLIAAKPEVKINSTFVANLHEQLLEMETNIPTSSFNFFSMKNYSYVLGSLVLVLIIGSTLYFKPFGINLNSRPSLIASSVNISDTGEKNAFGKLINEDLAPATEAFGLGGGGMEETEKVAAPIADSAVTSTTEPNIMPPVYNSYNYNFKYVGEPLKITDNEVQVLNRVKNETSKKDLFDWLEDLNIGVLDMSKFKNTYVQSMSVMEDREYGYSLYMDFSEESVSIGQNWNKWPKCENDACWQNRQLFNQNPKNMPENEKLIEIADAFVKEYNLDTSIYGKPEVDIYWWQRELKNAELGGWTSYLPDSFVVRYPLLINGKKVYFDSGNVYGLDISIDIREMKVSGVWNLSTQNYSASNYEAETDTAKLQQIAENGGWQNYDYNDPNGTQFTVELDTPEIAYVKIWRYEDGTNSEFLVPAFIFPIKNNDQLSLPYHKQQITVPLAKEILEKWESGPIAIPL